MKGDVMKFSALCVAGALLIPGAAAANATVDAKLEVRAAADVASAQQLAKVAPRKADALLQRSRRELRAAFERTEKRAAEKQTRPADSGRRAALGRGQAEREPGGVQPLPGAVQVPALALERRKAPLPRSLPSAPERIRTSTPQMQDQALNLARLPVPPQALVAERV